MGILDRIKDTVVGFAEGGGDLLGLTWDIASAPFEADDFGDLKGELVGSFTHRGASALNNFFGPDRGLGAFFGGLPEASRKPVRGAISGLEWLYDEGVSQPVSTLMIMGSLADSEIWERQGMGGFGAFFDPDAWEYAYSLAEHTSPGQSIAFAVGTKDILDFEETSAFAGTDMFKAASGTVDLLFRWYRDPDILLGKLIQASPSRLAKQKPAGFVETIHPGVEKLAKVGTGRIGRRLGVDGEKLAAHLTAHTPKWFQTFLGRDVFDASDMELLLRNERIGLQADIINLRKRVDDAAGMGYQAQLRSQLTEAESLLDGLQVLRRGDISPADMVKSPAFRKMADAQHEWVTNYLSPKQKRQMLSGLIDDTPTFHRITNHIDEIKESGLTQGQVTSRIMADIVPGHPQGMLIASALAEAKDMRQYKEVFRNWMGDPEGIRRLEEWNWALAKRQEDLTREGSRIHKLLDTKDRLNVDAVTYKPREVSLPGAAIADDILDPDTRHIVDQIDSSLPPLDDVRNYKERLSRINEELDAVADELERGRRWRAFANTAREEPRLTRARKVGVAFRESTFYQQTPFGKVLQIFPNNKPYHVASMADSNAADQLARTLRQAKMPSSSIADWKGRLAAASIDARAQVWDDAMDAATTHMMQRIGKKVKRIPMDADLEQVLRRKGLDDDTVETMMEQYKYAVDENGKFFREAGELVENTAENKGAVLERFAEAGHIPDDWMHLPFNDQAMVYMASKYKSARHAADRMVKETTKFDAEGRALMQIHDEAGHLIEVEMPLMVTQLDHAKVVPDFTRMQKELLIAARLDQGTVVQKSIAVGSNTKRVTVDGLDAFMRFWKPTVLLRPAWFMRVVLMDEQLRMLAKFGTLSALLGGRKGIAAYGRRLATDTRTGKALHALPGSGLQKGIVAAGIGGAILGGGDAALAAAGGAAALGFGGRFLKSLARVERAGYPQDSISGWTIGDAFGEIADNTMSYKELASARLSYAEFLDAYQGRFLAGLKRNPGMYTVYRWGDDAVQNSLYTSEWVRLIRNHYTSDPLVRRILAEGTSPSAIDRHIRWVLYSPEGIAHARRLPWRKTDYAEVKKWVESLGSEVDSYIHWQDDVRDAILNLNPGSSDKAIADILDMIPTQYRRPIHGAAFEQVVGRGPIVDFIANATEEGFKVFSEFATDELSRHPTFRRLYDAEIRRTIGPYVNEDWFNEDLLKTLEDNARRYALTETKNLLYDLAERSEFAEMTRLLMPFFPAFQEVLTRWAGLAWENPVIIPRALEIWEAPDRAGMVYTDDTGEEWIVTRIPEAARKLVDEVGFFKHAVDSQGRVRFNKRGFNLVAQGTPGFGPIVQYPVSKAIEAEPRLEEVLDFIVPFGSVDSLERAILSPTFQKLWDESRGEESKAKSHMQMRIAMTKIVKMETGDPTAEWYDLNDPEELNRFMSDVNEEANALSNLRIVAGLFSPVAPVFDTPYILHIDAWRALRDRDWERAEPLVEELAGAEGVNELRSAMDELDETTVDAIFYKIFGEEFMALTRSFTRANDGVAPTTEAAIARREFEGLVEAYPEWGGVITGWSAGGEATKFSQAMYAYQQKTPVAPGSDVMQREIIPLSENVLGLDVQLGWEKYSKLDDMITAEMVSRGLANLNRKEAEDLREARAAGIEEIASQHPQWYYDWTGQAKVNWDLRLQGAVRIVSNDVLSQRPDIAGLADYLAQREIIIAALERRQEIDPDAAKTLGAQSNGDLADAWATMVNKLVERNPAFGDLYIRMGFEWDPMDRSIIDIAGEDIPAEIREAGFNSGIEALARPPEDVEADINRPGLGKPSRVGTLTKPVRPRAGKKK